MRIAAQPVTPSPQGDRDPAARPRSLRGPVPASAPLLARWEVIQHAAIAVALFAHMDAEEAVLATQQCPDFSRGLNSDRALDIHKAVTALHGVMRPALEDLYERHRENREVASFACLQWIEFRRAQKDLIRLCRSGHAEDEKAA